MPTTQPNFDPYELLAALDRHRVTYIVIGALARVIHGSGEVTRGLDIVPSTRPENVRRLQEAVNELRPEKSVDLDTDLFRSDVVELHTDRGVVRIVATPTGTRGYDDLRRAANREPLGRGLRPSVASVGDLIRMLGALGREQDLPPLHVLRRVAELERSRGIELTR